MKLSELNNGEAAIIVKVSGRGAFRKRITEMGFVKGQIITAVKNAPFNDPVEYTIMGYEISLRRSEAELIEITAKGETIKGADFKGVIDEKILKISAKEKRKDISVALVGNPNCGKTTLFNFASGAKEHVGNYSGVTVEAKKGTFKQAGYNFDITDLPGTYSLTAYSPEELYVRSFILEELPDVVINVLDASNLERNLYLTARLIDLDIKVVIALNMYDELLSKGDKLDFNALAEMTGIPIVPTTAYTGEGINSLFSKVIEVYEETDPIVRHIHINYGASIESAIKRIQGTINKYQNIEITNKIAPRSIALNLLEKDKETIEGVKSFAGAKDILDTSQQQISELENALQEDTETLVTDARYGFINGALKETFRPGAEKKRKLTETIDAFITHKVFGFPIFLFFMWAMFQATFSLGQYPMDWIDAGVSLLNGTVQRLMPNGMLKDLISDGIISGVGGVIIFLPNILILFFFISLMEDTGYMARAAFIMDKLMHKIGLHGKSFIPLIMGFGCNVPAIMSTRTIENRNDRLLTILINPFMSCSARLPVYIVIIGAVFPTYAGTALFSIYALGILAAIVMAKLFKKTLFKTKEAPFVMELPPYRKPVFKTTLKHMWRKGAQYLQKMGGIILIASIIIWTLGYFPQNTPLTEDFDAKIETVEFEFQQKIKRATSAEKKVAFEKEKLEQLSILKSKKESLRQSESYIGQIGHFIEPVISPLGFDWKIGVSITAGIAAKEIVVSTMSVLYGADEGNASKNLTERLKLSTFKDGSKVYTPVTAVSLLVFVLLYFPCIAVIAAVRKETGSVKWAAFTVFYTTALAWLASFAMYQIGNLFF